MAITGITPLATPLIDRAPKSTQSSASNPADQVGQSFNNMLNTLTQSEQQSNDLITQLSTGGNVDLHEVMIGLEQTDIQFKVAMAIRDKLVDAYRETMRMQV